MDKPGYKTSEFWVTSATTLLGFLAVVFHMSATDTASLTSAVTTAIVSVFSILASAGVASKYISARTAVKLAGDSNGDGVVDALDALPPVILPMPPPSAPTV